MNLIKERQQRKEFCDILLELSKSQELLRDATYRFNMYKRLEALYDAEPNAKQFRHFYTDIFSVLTQVQQNPELGDINILGQNLDIIRNGYNPQNKSTDGQRTINVSDAINKLYDHVNLDIARIAYSDAADRRISGESSLETLQTQINSLYTEIQEIQAINKDVEDKLNTSQKEYISILGIFAAVVLAFTGGITFSTSVLNNIAQASIYRTVGISLIIGLVLVNVLFGLFYYINSLVNKHKKDIVPLIISNAIIVILLVLTIIAWNCGFVENRNDRINRPQNISTNEPIFAARAGKRNRKIEIGQDVGVINTCPFVCIPRRVYLDSPLPGA